MGKYHWKVEKQPEWYVKAVRKTIAALPGGYAEAADWLDVTENALFNRLRADGDQIFPLGWAMVLQRAAGTHYIADAVAQSAGGVFVSLPEIEEVENADINQRLLEVIEQIGNYSKQIRSAIEDGVSAYAMAGVAYSRVSTFSGDYLRVTDNKGKTHDVLTGSDDGRHSNTSLAWGAGVQFNPTESVAIDIAYEGSGSGDWRTDGFIVGVGYKF